MLVRRAALLVVVLVAAGCGEARSTALSPSQCATWQDTVGPRLRERCGGCHGGPTPAAGYDVGTYLGTLAADEQGVARALPGEAGSRLLAVLDPVSADANHRPFVGLRAELTTWVVPCRLAYQRQGVHPPGILDPADPDFHGRAARARSYDLSPCAGCHGEDFAGGRARKSCRTCHADGPYGCTTCHDNPPRSGAHAVHLEGTTASRPLGCVECHRVPERWDTPGHVLRADGSLEPRGAQVVFEGLAAASIAPDHRAGPAAYDTTARRCDNVYCHGDTFGDAHASRPRPRWTAPAAGAAPDCGGCHGAPPAGHGSSRCIDCHRRVTSDGQRITDRRLHLDGRLSLGDDQGSCASCHFGPAASAPDPLLAGTAAADAPAIAGAHAAHLGAPSGLRGPMTCGDCHLVPRALLDPGHIDSQPPAEVFPGSTAFASIALADGAAPRWSRGDLTCAAVYCHGGGRRLSQDRAPTLHQTPSWTGDHLEVRCGACHGIPPTTAIDDHGTPHPASSLDRCYQCHPNTIDAFGAILVNGPPGARVSYHINGRVDTP